jgi:hypothetical protein
VESTGIDPPLKADRSMKGRAMPPLSLEQRVAVLEQELSELKSRRGNGRDKDWRRTVGMFTDNPGMKELFSEAMKLREADRSKARRPQQRKRPAKS